MKFSSPEPLDSGHRIEKFDSGKSVLDDWLVRFARQSQASGSARTFVVSDAERNVIAFYSLTVGQVDVVDAPRRIREGMGRYPIPVVILARMAVGQGFHGRGIGAGLLRDAIRRTLAIADQAGIRAMLVHPIDETAERFYTRFGFVPSPIADRQFLLLLKDARRRPERISLDGI